MDDYLEQTRARVLGAAAAGATLRLRGGGSKDFYGGDLRGDVLETAAYRGIVAYDPSELVVTVRAGTPLADVEATLAASGQMLAFEAPHFGAATVGGCVAAGLSGPRRPYAGSLRDAVLGVTMMDGRGEVLRFGGQVMKNVAGFDVFRLQAGALGTLGVLLEVSFKVLPRPEMESTRVYTCNAEQALELMNRHAGLPLPLSGASFESGRLRLRLSGNAPAVQAAEARLGGDVDSEGAAYWQDLREHRLPFYAAETPLWRLSVPSTRASFADSQTQELIDWGGAQRWLRTTHPAETIRARAHAAGGHATQFRNGARNATFQPLAPALRALHLRLKQTFDPAGVFNRGRLYPDF
jgi:glycolate oxidase FAD binding subunit